MASRRTALITGGGRNIGRACVLGLAEDGFNVVINGSSDRAACEAVAKQAAAFGVETLVVMGDVGERAELHGVVLGSDASVAAGEHLSDCRRPEPA